VDSIGQEAQSITSTVTMRSLEQEIEAQSVLQCSKETGIGAVTQVYFRKGARWMRDTIWAEIETVFDVLQQDVGDEATASDLIVKIKQHLNNNNNHG
jgi:hypothetical protein